MRSTQIPLYSHVRSGYLDGIVTHIDSQSEEPTICQILYEKIRYVPLKDFVRKFRHMQVCEYYLPKLSEVQILQNIQALATSTDLTNHDPYVNDDWMSCINCIYGGLTYRKAVISSFTVFVLFAFVVFIVWLKDLSMFTPLTLGYSLVSMYLITMSGLWLLIYRPSKIVDVELDPELTKHFQVSIRDLKPGDHLVRPTWIGTRHHGLICHIKYDDLQEIYVLHNTEDSWRLPHCLLGSSNNLTIVTLEQFLQRYSDLWLIEYPGQDPLEPIEILDRILTVINSPENYYHLFRNNCELISLYSRYGWSGEYLPRQIRRYLSLVVFSVMTVMIVGYLIYKCWSDSDIQALVLIVIDSCMIVIYLRWIIEDLSTRAYVEIAIHLRINESGEDQIGLLHHEDSVINVS